MPVIGRTTREYQYRCDKSSTGDEKLALQPHEMLTMALISISKEAEGISDNEGPELQALSLIAEDWAPLLDGRDLRDKNGAVVLDDYSRIMINGTLDEDTGTIVPIFDENENENSLKKAIKITPLNVISANTNDSILKLVATWMGNVEDGGEENHPEWNKYASQVNSSILTKEMLYSMASEKLRPLVQVEIFSDYVYAEIENNTEEETEEENDEKPKTKTIVLEAEKCIYTENKYWTDEKLTQHGFISKSPSLIWE